jgi:hypothetical protein
MTNRAGPVSTWSELSGRNAQLRRAELEAEDRAERTSSIEIVPSARLPNLGERRAQASPSGSVSASPNRVIIVSAASS